ncbi:dTDP-4-dehydrorhamnose reductase [Georgenia daeguensis]|uniref:dTDP-4-dehydrorhamnose reductase n=1 Tax=Georgenia daeguensis TaxID=908355 RepID=A0ABP6UP40_9MICO
MRWIVTGAAGMLGTDLVERLAGDGQEVRALGRSDLDVTDARAVAREVRDVDIVVNCAAWTAVDDAEAQEAAAFELNAVAPQLLARAARETGARMVQISTDYVFDGESDEPYAEDAALAPRSAYGRTKAAGEWAVRAENPDHLVVRTAWLYGAHGGCFPKTMARLAADRPELQVVADQVGQPTWTADVADLVISMVEAEVPAGTYHATSSGQVSWHGFTRAIVQSLGKDPEMVRETTSDAFVRPAPRPSYSVLGHAALERAGVEPIGDWAQRWSAAASTVLGR